MQDEVAVPEDPRVIEIAVAVVRRGEEVLVGRRPQEAVWGGFWEFPGGKVKPGETPEEAAVRECKEETGYSVQIRHLLAIVDQETSEGTQRIHFFLAEVLSEEGQPPEDQEGRLSEPNEWPGTKIPPGQAASDSFTWVPLARLRTLQFPPANLQVLELLLGP